MSFFTRTIFFLAMFLLGAVSMWTTYQSLHDSILPEPMVRIAFSPDFVWDCSIFALMLSVAIGMMLFALKIAIVDEKKRLNIFGVLGLTVIGFISIAFNLDVLYRTADRDFFIRYSTEQMRGVYENYLSEAQGKLVERQESLRKVTAKQEGELDAEIRGLRTAPQGYGPIAKKEDYELTVLAKTTAVELESVDAALVKKEEADTLLRSAMPASIEEIEKLQNELRVIVKDVGVVGGLPLPAVVRTESPLFAVFSKVFDWRNIGIKEIFFVVLAFFLDLGDIIGYSMVPNRKRKAYEIAMEKLGNFPEPGLVVPPHLLNRESESLALTHEETPGETLEPPEEDANAEETIEEAMAAAHRGERRGQFRWR